MGLEIRRLVALSSMYCVGRWRWMQMLKKGEERKRKEGGEEGGEKKRIISAWPMIRWNSRSAVKGLQLCVKHSV